MQNHIPFKAREIPKNVQVQLKTKRAEEQEVK